MRLFAMVALLIMSAAAFGQVKCSTGFPGVTPTDCTMTWQTPTVDAPNIVSFQVVVDGGAAPVSLGLPATKTSLSGVDTWTLSAPTSLRTLPAGSHTAQIEACGATQASCTPASPASNAFQPVLTTPRSLSFQ